MQIPIASLGGASIITSLVSGYTTEMATLMCTAVIACYTIIGGLGATFYASYFNTALIFMGILYFCMKTFTGGSEDESIGGFITAK